MSKQQSLTPIFLATLVSFFLACLYEDQFFASLIGILLLATNFCFWFRVVFASLNQQGVWEVISFIIGKSILVMIVLVLMLLSKGDFLWAVFRGASLALIIQVIFLAYCFRPSKLS